MSLFSDYARYYNLLYRDKDYNGETLYILKLLNKHGCSPKTLLDLGCGTGRHALEMTKHGISVTGVDMSQTMLDMGNELIDNQNTKEYSVSLPTLLHGDARTVRVNKKYDVVTSLFHVLSYQNTEEDALAVLKTAKEHLNTNGLFLFDFWYGPGVLTDPPTIREKVIEDNEFKVYRKATPVHRVNDNIVEVHYDVCFTSKKNGHESSLNECHTMRYWFYPELKYLIKKAGFNLLDFGAWMEDKKPDNSTWGAWILASKDVEY